ncbi:uncharacterized protein [Nicotiana tomentosiformis]|uniref:uncharacterized protein n=1 Tax=Nicotiana tomentosiformis TaxID=4098 RepID=UPI00388C680C
MTDPEAQGAETSKTPTAIVHIDTPSEEDSGESEGESDDGATEDEETDEEALAEETEGQRDYKGKQVASSTEDASTKAQVAKEADVQKAIAHSLADMVARAHPATPQASLGESSSSQTPASSTQQKLPAPASETTTTHSEVLLASATESGVDPTVAQHAPDPPSA